MRISNPKDLNGSSLLTKVYVASSSILSGDGTESNPLTISDSAVSVAVYPSISGNSGNVLAVNSSESGVEWISLSGYATTSYVDEKVSSISSSIVDLSAYATISYVDSAISSSIESIDLSEYAVKSEVNSSISSIYSSINNFVTIEYLESSISSVESNVYYASSAGIANSVEGGNVIGAVSSAAYATSAGITTKLSSSVKIGSASFDGSVDITLSQIGAADSSVVSSHISDSYLHLPVGGDIGDFLKKTESGSVWTSLSVEGVTSIEDFNSSNPTWSSSDVNIFHRYIGTTNSSYENGGIYRVNKETVITDDSYFVSQSDEGLGVYNYEEILGTYSKTSYTTNANGTNYPVYSNGTYYIFYSYSTAGDELYLCLNNSYSDTITHEGYVLAYSEDGNSWSNSGDPNLLADYSISHNAGITSTEYSAKKILISGDVIVSGSDITGSVSSAIYATSAGSVNGVNVTGSVSSAIYAASAGTAAKLSSSVKIGSASFDGSSDVSVSDIGAVSISDFNSHTSDSVIHVNSSDRARWDAKSELSISVVSSLSSVTVPSSNVIYLVPSDNSGIDNIHDEYVYVGSSFEKIGTTQADLTDYVKTSDFSSAINEKQDKITSSLKLDGSLIEGVVSSAAYATSAEYVPWSGVIGAEENVSSIVSSIGILPSISGNSGKYLTVNSSETGTEWSDIATIQVDGSFDTPTSSFDSSYDGTILRYTGETSGDFVNNSLYYISYDSSTSSYVPGIIEFGKLPVATKIKKGVVMIGNGLSVTETGLVSVNISEISSSVYVSSGYATIDYVDSAISSVTIDSGTYVTVSAFERTVSGLATISYVDSAISAISSGSGIFTSSIDYNTIRTISGDEDFEELRTYCVENENIAVFTPVNTEFASENDLKIGHFYAAFAWDVGKFFYDLAIAFRSAFGWNTVETRYYFEFTGGTCVYNNNTYTLTPYSDGSSEGYALSYDPYSALHHKYLKISDTERIYAFNTGEGWIAWHQDYLSSMQGWQTGRTCSSFEPTYGLTHISRYGYDSSAPEVYKEEIVLFGRDITPGVYPQKPVIVDSSASSVTINPGESYSINLNSDIVVSAASVSDGYWASAEIDINPGTYNVSLGSNLTLVGSMTASKTNHCVVKWRGSNAKMKIIDVEE